MQSRDPDALFESLTAAQWPTAVRTYGSSHSTLIGLLAAWWIALSPTEHSVLDGAPSHGSGNAGWCDLMLCADDVAVGVVEVEGTKPLDKLRTLDAYFSSSRSEFGSIQFGLLMVYAYHVKGRGEARQYPPAETAEILSAARQVSAAHPNKALIVVALDKVVDRNLSTVRRGSPYHAGSFKRITAVLLASGSEVRRAVIFEAQVSTGTHDEA